MFTARQTEITRTLSQRLFYVRQDQCVPVLFVHIDYHYNVVVILQGQVTDTWQLDGIWRSPNNARQTVEDDKMRAEPCWGTSSNTATTCDRLSFISQMVHLHFIFY